MQKVSSQDGSSTERILRVSGAIGSSSKKRRWQVISKTGYKDRPSGAYIYKCMKTLDLPVPQQFISNMFPQILESKSICLGQLMGGNASDFPLMFPSHLIDYFFPAELPTRDKSISNVICKVKLVLFLLYCHIHFLCIFGTLTVIICHSALRPGLHSLKPSL